MWVARWWEDGIGPNGQPRRVRRSEVLGPVSQLSKRQAEQIFAELLLRVNRGEHRVESTRTLRAFVENEWRPQVRPTLKYATQKNYDYMLNTHVLPAFGDVQLRLITRDAVQNFLLGRLRAGFSWGTIKRLRVTFGTVMATAEDWGYVDGNVVRKTKLPRRGPRPEKDPISPELIRKLLDNLAEPSLSLAWLLVLTGLRIGELLALRWRDVDLEGKVLRVRRAVYDGHFDEPKTKRSNRTVPLPQKAVAILQGRHPKVVAGDALVFATRVGSPFSRRNLLRRQLAPTAKKLGLVGINWHALRHAHATFLDSVGTPLGTVQALLGHASGEVTRGHYIHNVPADARAAVEKVEQLLIGPNRTQIVEIPKTGSTVIQ
jgi:integrase